MLWFALSWQWHWPQPSVRLDLKWHIMEHHQELDPVRANAKVKYLHSDFWTFKLLSCTAIKVWICLDMFSGNTWVVRSSWLCLKQFSYFWESIVSVVGSNHLDLWIVFRSCIVWRLFVFLESEESLLLLAGWLVAISVIGYWQSCGIPTCVVLNPWCSHCIFLSHLPLNICPNCYSVLHTYNPTHGCIILLKLFWVDLFLMLMLMPVNDQ